MSVGLFCLVLPGIGGTKYFDSDSAVKWALAGKEGLCPHLAGAPSGTCGPFSRVVHRACFHDRPGSGAKTSGSELWVRHPFSVHAFAFFFQEDHYALLVKAWETKVFPTIRRRFRNEAERKSGLDQIKGALQLGLVLYVFLTSRSEEMFLNETQHVNERGSSDVGPDLAVSPACAFTELCGPRFIARFFFAFQFNAVFWLLDC